ncbi:hypothetical protein L6164_026049 [Bauhinia variegata]|uniref:Uncharacterized protein n=1 Tax=Bauhinia variegata TaxID=167791 RepID=A0ACB9M6B5_BAUVA|nr:hypothetical protein L6164_026049 [Bauhinia variegata]
MSFSNYLPFLCCFHVLFVSSSASSCLYSRHLFVRLIRGRGLAFLELSSPPSAIFFSLRCCFTASLPVVLFLSSPSALLLLLARLCAALCTTRMRVSAAQNPPRSLLLCPTLYRSFSFPFAPLFSSLRFLRSLFFSR